MRSALLVLLVVPMLAGCLTVFESDDDDGREVAPPEVPSSDVEVSGVRVWEYAVDAFDNTSLAVLAYEPTTRQKAADGSVPTWPVVVFVHGLGANKETFTQVEFEVPSPPVDLLRRFAEAGILAVAYDARGHGQSGGESTIAGPAEMADLDAIITDALSRFRTNGHLGITGYSYGGGHSMLGFTHDERVTTVVPHHGWVDLPEAIVPGNVPKIGWMNFLYAYGRTSGNAHPMMDEWYQAAWTRAQDPDSARAVVQALEARSSADAFGHVEKPIFICQGMQESLFPQVDRILYGAGGFARAMVHPGGHGVFDQACWARTLDWFSFFLAGRDTGVDTWAALETVDARDNDRVVFFPTKPDSREMVYGLREGDLVDGTYPNATFTIQQRLLANPLTEPAGLSDVVGRPPQEVPAQFTEDPQSVFFVSDRLTGSGVLLGAATLNLTLAENVTSWQVAATLWIESAEGGRTPIVRTAYASLDATDNGNGNITLTFPWTKADLNAGDAFVLEVSGNDPQFWVPLLANYEVTFTGDSHLRVPLFAA